MHGSINRLKSHNLYVLADDRSIVIFLISSPSCNTRDRNMQEDTTTIIRTAHRAVLITGESIGAQNCRERQ